MVSVDTNNHPAVDRELEPWYHFLSIVRRGTQDRSTLNLRVVYPKDDRNGSLETFAAFGSCSVVMVLRVGQTTVRHSF